MGKVLIIKNNNSDERISRFAKESYEKKKNVIIIHWTVQLMKKN